MRALRALQFGVFVALAALFAPLLVVYNWILAARVRSLGGGIAFTYAHALRVEDGALVAAVHEGADQEPAHRIPLARITSAKVWHVTGDSGFADANSQTYHMLLELDDGTRLGLVHSESYPFPFETAVIDPLRASGALRETMRTVRGPERGMCGCLLYVVLVAWCAAAAVIVRWWLAAV